MPFSLHSGSSRDYDENTRYRQPYSQQPYRTPRRTPGSFLPGFLMGSMLSGASRRARRDTMHDPGYDDPYDPRYNTPPGYGQRRSSGMIWIILLVLVIALSLMMCGCSSKSDELPASGYNREKIQNSTPFDADCIVDEAGFFEKPSKTGQRLKSFYDKTGIQPEIVILDYDPSLKTAAQKQQYAIDWYQKNIDNEDTFLYMYFSDADPDEVGFMQTVNGKNIDSVMDSQATDIFWNVLDSGWTGSQSTDDLFVDTFNKTADRIMTKSATVGDVAMRSLLVLALLITAGAVIAVVVLKHRRDRQKAEETRRILETPLHTDNPDDDDLVHRYGG